MDAKQILDAMRSATPEQREAMMKQVRRTQAEALITELTKRCKVKLTKRGDTWSLSGTPEELAAMFAAYAES